ncbi:unnamed protein product [Pelagomonas calceolata]|uniref:Uncharacterized protein n=1 Tax=Pelagomonas calceolata TaxID=35677 RepID=A0A8J2X307_9STRA|nr:unnamed protein product [Pelagomonas calceolata]
MAPPPGQTNRDTSAADHTTCFYCHQQLILVSHKVIVSRDAHGCSIRICEPCEKEARRRRPGHEGIEAMRKLMGGAADEEEEEGN